MCILRKIAQGLEAAASAMLDALLGPEDSFDPAEYVPVACRTNEDIDRISSQCLGE